MNDQAKNILHAADRNWPQSNCSVDLYIGVLHSWNLNPIACMSFTMLLDHEGDQFTFFKIPLSSLYRLYGIQQPELSIYKDIKTHIAMQVKRGNIVCPEVDGYYLPDTVGVSYKVKHTKTTIGINYFDLDAKRTGYFHNDTYTYLEGDDFDNIFNTLLLPSYVEFIKQGRHPILDEALLRQESYELAKNSVKLIPEACPINALRRVFVEQVSEINTENQFHEYAFNNFRMLGSNFEILATYLDWVSQDVNVGNSVKSALDIAQQAKILQFRTARMVSKKRIVLCDEVFDKLQAAYANLVNDIRIAFNS